MLIKLYSAVKTSNKFIFGDIQLLTYVALHVHLNISQQLFYYIIYVCYACPAILDD